MTDLNGKTFSLADYKGSIVFLEFWATWCPPCVMSMPEVQKLADEYKNKKFVVLSLSVDEDPARVRAFFEDKKPDSRVALVGDIGLESAYGVSGIPAFYLIDANGNAIKRWSGYNPMYPHIWRKEIETLLKKP